MELIEAEAGGRVEADVEGPADADAAVEVLVEAKFLTVEW